MRSADPVRDMRICRTRFTNYRTYEVGSPKLKYGVGRTGLSLDIYSTMCLSLPSNEFHQTPCILTRSFSVLGYWHVGLPACFCISQLILGDSRHYCGKHEQLPRAKPPRQEQRRPISGIELMYCAIARILTRWTEIDGRGNLCSDWLLRTMASSAVLGHNRRDAQQVAHARPVRKK